MSNTIKGIKLNCGQLSAADKKIEIIAKLCFTQPLSAAELSLLNTIVSYSTGNSITLTPALSKQIMSSAVLTQSSFNTSLHRLEKKGVLNSGAVGKTKNLHPVFNNIGDWDKVLVSFDGGSK